MSAKEIEPRLGFPPSPSPPPSAHPTTNANGIDKAGTQNAVMDIGEFVGNYKKMMEYLYPMELIGHAILYIFRSERHMLDMYTQCHVNFFLVFVDGRITSSH